jgi:hypothetical protein
MSLYTDAEGNLWALPVPVVARHATTTLFWIGDAHAAVQPQLGDEWRPLEGTGGEFLGGSGRNWRLDATTTGVQAGFYRPTGPDAWVSVRDDDWTWTREADGSFALRDGTDIVAGSPAVGGLTGVASAGTFPVVNWVVIADSPSFTTWVGVEDSTYAIVLEKSTGNAELHGGGTSIVADRLGGSMTDPAGVYPATPDGETDFNGGSPWTYTVTSTGPTGTANSTAYGEATYGGLPFTIDVEFEGGSEFTAREAVLRATGSSGTQEGFYVPTGWQSWEADASSGWTLGIDGSGVGSWRDGTDEVAYRDADASRLYDPAGRWFSTPYGALTYGDGGADFEVEISGPQRAVPLEGWWWGELVLDAGTNEVTGTEGPKFASGSSPGWPGNSPTLQVFPLAYSDGAGTVRPIWSGPIDWVP